MISATAPPPVTSAPGSLTTDETTDAPTTGETASATAAETADSDSAGTTGPGPLTPVSIDFDELAEPLILTDEYAAYVTFSTDEPYVIRVRKFGDLHHSSPPSTICPTGNPQWTCSAVHPLYMDFTAPVYDLKFSVAAVNDAGPIAQLHIHQDGVATATIPLNGLGEPDVPLTVDLSAYPAITRVEMVDIMDYYGVVWDDFTFSIAG